jgi:hypothetical protein
MISEQERLQRTWQYFPTEPVTIGGVPLSCPGCGSADGLRFWLYPGKDRVDAEHTCVPYTAYRTESKIRRWVEPRVSPEHVRQAGRTTLSALLDTLRDQQPWPPRQES